MAALSVSFRKRNFLSFSFSSGSTSHTTRESDARPSRCPRRPLAGALFVTVAPANADARRSRRGGARGGDAQRGDAARRRRWRRRWSVREEGRELAGRRGGDGGGGGLRRPGRWRRRPRRSLERCGWTKTSPDVSRCPPPTTTCCHHARERSQALAFRGEVTGARSRDHVTALALATAVPPTLAPGPAP